MGVWCEGPAWCWRVVCVWQEESFWFQLYFSLLTSLSFFASVLDRSENNQQAIIGDHGLGEMIESKIPTQVSLIEKYGKDYGISDFVYNHSIGLAFRVLS